MSVTRTEAYTDAVFAIAATLLVLDLTTHSIGEVSSDGELWEKLGEMSDGFMSFVVSFILLSMLWIIHMQQFNLIARVDGLLLWLNNIRLLFIVLVPFTTSLVSDYSDWYAGRMLLPINFFFAALFSHLSWLWAAGRDQHLLKRHMEPDELRQERNAGRSAVICGAIAAIASPWLGSSAFLVYAVPPLVMAIRRRALSRRNAG